MSLHPPTDRSATREPAPERHGLAIVAPVTVNHPRVWAAAIALGFALAGPAAFGTASAEVGAVQGGAVGEGVETLALEVGG